MVLKGKPLLGRKPEDEGQESNFWPKPTLPSEFDTEHQRRIGEIVHGQERWFEENRDRLYANSEFRNKIIAVLDEEVIGCADDMQLLFALLDEQPEYDGKIILTRRVTARKMKIVSDEEPEK